MVIRFSSMVHNTAGSLNFTSSISMSLLPPFIPGLCWDRKWLLGWLLPLVEDDRCAGGSRVVKLVMALGRRCTAIGPQSVLSPEMLDLRRRTARFVANSSYCVLLTYQAAGLSVILKCPKMGLARWP